MTTKPTGNVYEMLWDCKFCGTNKLLGKTHRFCPNCGAQQDASWRYFPSDEEKVAVEDHVYVGADKVCPACNSLSAANAEFCGNCGSPLSEAARAKAGATRQQREGTAFQTENLKARQAVQSAAAHKLTAQPAASAGAFGGKRLYLILGVVALVIGGAIFALTRTTEAAAYVTGHRWEREIRVESLQAQTGSGDCDSMPAGAYNVDRSYEQVDTRRVADGETCERQQVDQGDGTFREERVCETTYREEPVYGYVCYYTVNRWGYSRSVEAQGDLSNPPVWPATSLRSGNCLGCEREQSGGRDEAYYLIFRGDGGRTFECGVPFETWQGTPVEQAFTVKVGAVLNDVRCDTLQTQ